MVTHQFSEHAGGRQSLGEFALFYASRGFAVFPLMRGSKRPYQGTNGVHDATDRLGTVRAMWEWAPHSNIGLATGSVSDVTVLDLDVKSGPHGPTELAAYVQGSGAELLEVPWSSTPSGGRHLWLRGAATSRTGILPGVDVKSDGGYVLAPPSGLVMPRLEAGQDSVERIVPYLWESGCPCEMPAVPLWMEQWTASAPGTGGAVLPGYGGAVLPEVEVLKAKGLAVGSRNEVSSRVAASLFRKWGTSAEGYRRVTEEMREIWDATDKSGGFTWQEVLTVIRHAHRYISRREREDRAVEDAVLGYLRRNG